MATFFEVEYSAYANKTGQSGISLYEQKISYYNSQLGTNYTSLDEAEIAFLKNKTTMYECNSKSELWTSYMIFRGVSYSNSISDMKYAFYTSFGFE